jgi:hypothetical protein
MFKKFRKSFVFMLVFLLIASFSGSVMYPTHAVTEELPDGANLTGNINDAGVDADGNGKFDYLRISVEVSVTVAGEYVVNVYSARTSEMRREYLNIGTHMVDIYVYGPAIYETGNLDEVFHIWLQSVRYENFMPKTETLDDIYGVPLSRQYNYAEFDAPFGDVEATFTVFPDGSVALSGALGYTHMVPFNPGPEVQGIASITRNGGVTVASANCTFFVPPDTASRFLVDLPFNTSEVSYQEQYSGTQLSSDLSANMTLPPSLVSEYPFNTTDFSMLGTYSEGLGSMSMNFTTSVPESIRSMFPLNVTDVTVTGQYTNEQLTGKITFHVVSGFPIFDLDMNFEGNKTALSLAGEGLVIYGYYPNIGFEIDRAMLEGLLVQYNSSIPGQGLGSLYEMTDGVLECTYLDTTLTSYDSIGAWVDFDVGIQGDFIELIAYMAMQSFTPYMFPLEDREQVHDMIYATLNTTVNSVESVDFQIAYTHDTGEAEIRMTFVDDVLDLVSSLAEIAKNATALDPGLIGPLYSIIYTVIPLNATLPYIGEAQIQLNYSSSTGKLQLTATSSGEIDPEAYYYPTYFLPEEMPSELRELFESLQQISLFNVTSYNESFTFGNSVGSFRVECTLEGDVNAQADLVKSVIVTYMNLTSPEQIAGPELLFLNQTRLDIANLQMNFNVGNTSVTGELTGVRLSPPTDPVNATCFRLERFFDLASVARAWAYEYPLPIKGRSLRIAVKGGSNGTHTVTLFIDQTDPEKVPDPDEFAEGNTLVWHNQSISNLKRLLFKVWEGCAEAIHDPASVTQDNPFRINAEETASCVLTLTDVSKPVTISIKNVTAPTEVGPLPGTYTMLGNYIQILADPEDVTAAGTVRICYTPEQLSESGLDENSLKIFWWDEAANDWKALDTQINTAEHYAWATVSHLSIWTLMGQLTPPLWEQPWFLISTVAIVAAVIIVVIFSVRRKK